MGGYKRIHLFVHHVRGRGVSLQNNKIRYLLININTSYNLMLGQSSINRLRAIVSTPHLIMNFPSTVSDIVTVHVDQKTACECYVSSLKVELTSQLYKASPCERSMGRKGRSPGCKEPTRERPRERKTKEHTVALVDLYPRLHEARIEPSKALCPIPLQDNEHRTHMGTSLKPDDNKLVSQT